LFYKKELELIEAGFFSPFSALKFSFTFDSLHLAGLIYAGLAMRIQVVYRIEKRFSFEIFLILMTLFLAWVLSFSFILCSVFFSYFLDFFMNISFWF